MQEDVAAPIKPHRDGKCECQARRAEVITIHHASLLVKSELEDSQDCSFRREKTPLPFKGGINSIDWC